MSGPIRSGLVVLIAKPGDPELYGPVERSFSLDISKGETERYWTSKHYKIDAREWAERTVNDWKKTYPNYTYTIWDLEDPKIPVHIDWEKFDWAIQPDKDKMSGVVNKYYARNLRFTKKSAHDLAEVEYDQAQQR